eukprot:TRINITY_DN10268_c0_g1_i2.p2 TRINITY_DN10268_c0_g1~~TRINITY_DN10268_c0_g1_i2.p2  ORF type:complete len:144 (-),score=24.98 TRINITY_DN10268_c0_g1_i2:603-1034(-)
MVAEDLMGRVMRTRSNPAASKRARRHVLDGTKPQRDHAPVSKACSEEEIVSRRVQAASPKGSTHKPVSSGRVEKDGPEELLEQLRRGEINYQDYQRLSCSQLPRPLLAGAAKCVGNHGDAGGLKTLLKVKPQGSRGLSRGTQR